MQSNPVHHTHVVRRVLGVDPGLRRTGYALLVGSMDAPHPTIIDAGVVRLATSMSLEQRLAELTRCMQQLLEAHRPTVLACEQLYTHYKHPRTAILMAHARGVILAAAAQAQLAVLSLAATQVKKTLTGHGRAGKTQMQRAVTATFRLREPPEPHDVADAIAIALCGLRMPEPAPRTGEGGPRLEVRV